MSTTDAVDQPTAPVPPTPGRPTPPAPAGPPPGRRSGAWVAILVALVGAVVVVVMVAQGVVTAIGGGGRTDDASYSLDVSDITAVEIDVSSASLVTTFADVPQATLDVEATGWRADARWTFEVDGDRLVVSDSRRTFFWPDFGTREVRAELVLPSELEGRIDADLDLSAGELDITGDLASTGIQVSAGSLTLTGATESLAVDISAGSATVVTDGPETIDVEVSAGRFTGTVTGAPPSSTTIDVSAGDVVLELPDGAYALSGEVSAGDRQIEVRTDPSSPNTLVVELSAGDARIGYSD